MVSKGSGNKSNIAGSKSSTGSSKGNSNQGRGQGNAGGWPSTTGKPSGGGRSNNVPKK